jgi:dihydropteroate synthase
MNPLTLQCAKHSLNLNAPAVMGILNVTPDSFSDGGRFDSLDRALFQAEKMAADGAAIIDVGGESTRPGAQPVTESEELDRVIPVIEKIHRNLDIVISIDTSKAKVMTEAAAAGAGLINDVMALRAEGALDAACNSGLPVCLMHMQGQPRSMQNNPHYNDVVTEVKDFLLERAQQCIASGMNKTQLILDPGFGFGKTLSHNIELFKQLDRLQETGYAVLVGASRKSMIGQITGKAVEQRLAGSLALATMAAMKHANIIRVHDVAETVDVIKMVQNLT